MSGVVVDGDLDVVPLLARHRVPPGQERVEVQSRLVHHVVEVAAPPVFPLLLKVADRQRRLVRARRKRGLERHPVGVRSERVAEAPRVVRFEPLVLRRKAVLLSLVLGLQLVLGVVADVRHDVLGREERAVFDHARVGVAVHEAGVRYGAVVDESQFSAGLERLGQRVDDVAQLLVAELERVVEDVRPRRPRIAPRDKLKGLEPEAVVRNQVDLADGLVRPVDQHDVAVHLYPALIRIHVDGEPDVRDPRLREPLVLLVALLEKGRPAALYLRVHVRVQDVRVVEDPPADTYRRKRDGH